MENKPVFPLRVFFDDGEEWELNSVEDIECNLEWFDSDDGDESAYVLDHLGRPVRIKVEALVLQTCELVTIDF